MKTTVLRFSILIAASLCLTFLGYRWWQVHQKRKELFVYFQSKSKVTQRIPPDALVYINLFDFKRVHGSLQQTQFYEVLEHWLDTGMSDKQKANRWLGSMMEKTILDIIGREFGIGIMPSQSQQPDVFVVAELTPGSDFLLKLALANAKHVRKLEQGDRMIYAFATKTPLYTEMFVTVDEDFAYACTSLARLSQAFESLGPGPTFLGELSVEPIPEDTFLFIQSRSPRLSAVAYGSEHTFHLLTASEASALGPIPVLGKTDSSVLRIQTNATEILQQPSASFLLQSVNQMPLSTLVLGFKDRERARNYDDYLVRHIQGSDDLSVTDPPVGIETFKTENAECHQSREKGIVCRSQNVLLLTNGGLLQVVPPMPMRGQSPLPLTVRVEYGPESVRDFLQRVQQKDWSLFPQARVFYFLSCVKSIAGSIDRSNNELTAELY